MPAGVACRPRIVSSSHPEARQGVFAAALCYVLWGAVPLYWKLLHGVDAVELIAHRHVWSLLVLVALLPIADGFAAVRDVLRSGRAIALHLLSALLLTTNWLVYVYGVLTDRVTDCSLGYYLVPLVNVAVGRFALHERIRPLQWLAIAGAAVGVTMLVVARGTLPWIAILLAVSWGAYSLLRKRSQLAAIPGLAVETLLLAPLAIGWLVVAAARGGGVLGHTSPGMHALVLASGLVTALPLMLFAYGARRIRLTTLGLLQYISPSLQLVLGVMVYGEPFRSSHLVSFGCIWLGLVLYAVDSARAAAIARA